MAGYSGEKSVLARFPSAAGAAQAAGELREAGYHTVQVGRISHYQGEYDDAAPYSGDGEMSNMTVFSSSAGASAYGGYAGAADAADEGGDSFLVTVVTDDGNFGQVKEILERHGATALS